MLPITQALWDILATKLQVGASGHRARLEVGTASPGDAAFVRFDEFNRTISGPAIGTSDAGFAWGDTTEIGSPGSGNAAVLEVDGSRLHFLLAGAGSRDVSTEIRSDEAPWSGFDFDLTIRFELADNPMCTNALYMDVGEWAEMFVRYGPPGSPAPTELTPWRIETSGTGSSVASAVVFDARGQGPCNLRWQVDLESNVNRAKVWKASDAEPDWQVEYDATGDDPPSSNLFGIEFLAFSVGSGDEWEAWIDYIDFAGYTYPAGSSSTTFIWTPYPLETVSVDKSYGADADAMSATLPNQDGALSPLLNGPVINHDTPVRLFQWYGPESNEVNTFTGLANAINDHREPHTLSIRALDRMKLLLDESVIVTAPQGADDEDAVRDPSNYVWLNAQVADIANDILDKAGWPADKRDITETNYVVDEFIMSLGDSHAGGLRRLFNLVVYEPSVDEAGSFQAHPRPSVLTGDSTDDPVTAVASFSGANEVTVLDAGLDDQGLRTRVLIFGPAATAPTETWDELWHSNAIKRPNGSWANPDDLPGYVWIVDGKTRKVYRLNQTTRTAVALSPALSSNSLAGGIDGNDPTDTDYLWALETPWHNSADGLPSSGDPSKIRKVRISDWTTVASHSLGSGHWSAIAQADGKLYLANLTTHAIRILDAADFSTIDTISLPSAPSGVTASDTELWVFLGSTISVRLLSDPSTETTTHPIPGAGGGDLDPTDPTVMYVDVPGIGAVYKYRLIIPGTPAIGGGAVDWTLEDALGARAGVEPRLHDGCPNDDDPHPYQIRLETVSDDKLVSSTQAQDTANRMLARLSRRRRTVQIGIVANPAIQKGDPIEVHDPPSGLDHQLVMVQTYSTQQAGGTYLGVISGPLWTADY